MRITTRAAALLAVIAPMLGVAAPIAPGVLQFSAASYKVAESTSTLVVTVTRSGGKSGVVSTLVSTSDIRAIAHHDYTPISVKVAFADGDSNDRTVSIPILDDTLAERDEALRVSLGEPTGGAQLGAHSTATATIIDDEPPPTTPTLSVHAEIKRLRFSWTGGVGADYYRLSRSDLGQREATVPGNVSSATLEISVHRFDWRNAHYRLSACNPRGCTDSNEIDVVNRMLDAIGYFKASNAEQRDQFGGGDWFADAVAVSADGKTLAVGAQMEASDATGIDADQGNGLETLGCGAVYVFTRTATGQWSQQAYLKASNTGANSLFGGAVALSADGNTLAVGARNEYSDYFDTGAVYVFSRLATQWSEQAYIKPPSASFFEPRFGKAVALSADGDTLAVGAVHASSVNTWANGAVHVFARVGTAWSQQAYVTASNMDSDDFFGYDVALSAEGDTLAVGAPQERSRATGIDGDQADNSGNQNGAVYVFQRIDAQWTQQAYVKASNTTDLQRFGSSVALSGSGDRLAVGAPGDRSSATGINGDEFTLRRLAADAGAVHLFSRTAHQWSKEAYIKASNTNASDAFGASLALSADGGTLGVGAIGERSSATGIDGNHLNNGSGPNTGAAYVFEHDGSGWSQRAYVKASNTDSEDAFGTAIALSGDGSTLAVAADGEDSAATGVGGAQSDNSAPESGAVYLY